MESRLDSTREPARELCAKLYSGSGSQSVLVEAKLWHWGWERTVRKAFESVDSYIMRCVIWICLVCVAAAAAAKKGLLPFRKPNVINVDDA